MAQFNSLQVTRGDIVPNALDAVDVVPLVADFTVPAGLAANDTVILGTLPAGHVPVDLIVDNEDCGGTITADFGLVAANGSVGAEFINDADLGTAGIKRLSAAGGARIAPSATDRRWGIAFAAATTPTAGAKVRATLLVRPQSEGG